MTQRAPGIDWDAFLAGAQLPNQQRFGAYHAQAITRLSALVASQPLQAWKDWLAFHQINSNADVLPSAIDQAHFAFYGTTLSGTPQQRDRAKRALDSLGVHLGDAVGQAYVQRYFPASAREEVQGMVENIKTAFAARIRGLEWMAEPTRQEALRKVETLSSASAIRTPGAIIHATPSPRQTPTPTPSTARARNTRISWPSSAIRWIATSGG